MESLAEGDRLRFLDLLPTDVASETLAEMDGDEHPEELLADMEPSKAAALLLELEDDDAADLVGDLEPADAEVILSALPAEEAGEIRDLLTHDEETAAISRDLLLDQTTSQGQIKLRRGAIGGPAAPGNLKKAIEDSPTLEKLLPYQDQILSKAGELAGIATSLLARTLASGVAGTPTEPPSHTASKP